MIPSGLFVNQRFFIGHFIIKFLFFVMVFLAFDYLLGIIFEYFYFKQKSGVLYRTTYSMEQTKADILVFGSSRGMHHYHPDVFQKRLKRSFYNVGRDGNFIFYHYAVLKSVLKRYSPQTIILDFSVFDFEKNKFSYDRIASLLPYYKTHPEIRPIVLMKGKNEKYRLVSNIYPYNSLMLTIAVGNLEFNKQRKGDIDGYVPLLRSTTDKVETIDNRHDYEIDQNKITLFKSFIAECRKQPNTELYIINSPYYIKFKYPDSSVKLGKEIAKKNHIPFIDFANDTAFINKPYFFADPLHLNDRGARVFSDMVIDTIVNLKQAK